MISELLLAPPPIETVVVKPIVKSASSCTFKFENV